MMESFRYGLPKACRKDGIPEPYNSNDLRLLKKVFVFIV
jgi:hypothetical protein